MPARDLTQFLASLVPMRDLSRGLRRAEDGVVRRVRGNVFALIAAYRYACRHVCSGRRRRADGSIAGWPRPIPRYHELPVRLRERTLMERDRDGGPRRGATVSEGQYAAITEWTEAVVRRLTARYGSLNHDVAALHRREFADEAKERRRRVSVFARQAKAIREAMAGNRAAGDAQRRGPAPRPVYCLELKRAFPSAVLAAAHLSLVLGREVRPSNLRTAIKRGQRIHQYTFVDGDRPPATSSSTTHRPSRRPSVADAVLFPDLFPALARSA